MFLLLCFTWPITARTASVIVGRCLYRISEAEDSGLESGAGSAQPEQVEGASLVDTDAVALLFSSPVYAGMIGFYTFGNAGNGLANY